VIGTAPFSGTVTAKLVAVGTWQGGLIVSSGKAVFVSVPSVAVTVMGYTPVDVEALVATVIVEVTALAPTDTVAGVKLAVAPEGSPVALSVTGPVYPPMGVMVVG
jgi:hypothetical protein